MTMAGKSSVVVAFLGDTTGLDKAMGKAQTNLGRMGGVFQKVGAQIGGEFGVALGTIGEGMDKLGEKSAKNAGVKIGALGAIATGVGYELMNMASGPQQAMAQLQQAITDSGHSYGDYRDEIEKTITAQQNFGHSETDTEAALQTLTQATNDPKAAIEQMGLVANLAAARHISLADSAALVAKVIAGKGARTLSQYGIAAAGAAVTLQTLKSAQKAQSNAVAGLAKANENLANKEQLLSGKRKLTVADEQQLKKLHEAVTAAQAKVTESTSHLTQTQQALNNPLAANKSTLDQLASKLNGQAAAATDNFAAKVGILRTKLGDWAAQTAGVVGPAIAALGPVLMVAGSAMEILTARKAAAAAADVALSAAQDVQTASTVAATGATDALAVSEGLALGPILLVVAAIALVVGALVLAYQHVGWFRAGVDAAMNGVKVAFGWIVTAAHTAFQWVADHKAILIGALAVLVPPIGAIILAVRFLGAHWKTIWNAIKTVMGVVWNNVLHPIFDAIGKVIDVVVKGVKILGTIWGTIFGGIKTVVLDVWNVIKPIFDKIGGAVSTVTGAISKVAGVASSIGSGIGGALTNVGHFLGFADGGPVPGPKGSPRLAVVHGGEYVLSNDMLSGRKPAGVGMSRGGDTVIVNNYHPTDTGQSVAQALRHKAFLMGAA